MERLTYRVKSGRREKGGAAIGHGTPTENMMLIPDAIDRLAAYEDTREAMNPIPFGRFRDIMEAERAGWLVVMPCKIGDVVYEANKRGFISTYKVISIHISECSVLIGWELIDGIYSSLNGFEVSALGKTVFLTREEAEAALKKRGEAGNETD